jgi:chromosome segregation ATPase
MVGSYAVERMREELDRRFAEMDSALEILRRRKQQLESEISRLVQAIAEGQGSQSIMAAIGEREKELRAISDQLLEKRPRSVRATLEELRMFAISRLTNLRKLLANPESIQPARALLAEHVGKIMLKPMIEQGSRHYMANGSVDFFGGEFLASRVGGAGGQSRTAYAGLFRAALYR